MIILSSSVEVILRAEAVELSQAGDKCDFTGTLIVVPDVAQLAMPGRSLVIEVIYTMAVSYFMLPSGP